jgi:hypothetical protein
MIAMAEQVFLEFNEEFLLIVAREHGNEFLDFVSGAVHEQGLDLPIVCHGFLDEEDALRLRDCRLVGQFPRIVLGLPVLVVALFM